MISWLVSFLVVLLVIAIVIFDIGVLDCKITVLAAIALVLFLFTVLAHGMIFGD